MMFESKQAKGRARVPSPPLRAEPADTAAPQQGRQSLIPLRRRQGLPETPRPLRRRSCLPETPGQYGNAAAMAAMSYSRHLARRRPAFWDGASSLRGGDVTALSGGEACTESKHTLRRYQEDALPPLLTLLCPDKILQANCILGR